LYGWSDHDRKSGFSAFFVERVVDCVISSLGAVREERNTVVVVDLAERKNAGR
jgi:hypothetical protein